MKFIRISLAWILPLLLIASALAQAPSAGPPGITLSGPNTWRLAMSTDSALSYQLELSEDLVNWISLENTPLPGDGGVHSQRVIVPTGAAKLFFRYRSRPRTAADGLFQDWDRFYFYQTNSLADMDGDGVPDALESALGSNPADFYSRPYQVVSVDPFPDQAGHALDRAIVIHLNKPIPSAVASVKKFFVKHVAYTLDGWFDVNESAGGSTMILPGRKAVAFLPSPSLVPGANNTALNNYRIYFGTDGTGIPGLMPWHSEFATVADYFDTVGAWVTSVLPGETAFEVAMDFAPVIEWSQPLLPSALLSPDVTVIEQASGNAVAVGVNFDYATNRMTLSHAAPFLPDATYTVTLGTGLVNLMGKPLLHPFTWSFRTRSPRPVPVAGQGPFVQAVSPADFSTQVDVATVYDVFLTFSEAMVPFSLKAATVHLREHGVAGDVPALITYTAATRVLRVSPLVGFKWGTRYELTLDAGAIYTVASPSKFLQGQSLFVFTTAPDPSATGGGGGTGTGPSTGTAGSQDPEKTKPLILSLSYGDQDEDAGASLKLSITLPDGSQREQEMPNATNQYATHVSPEIPAGSTVIVTPRFLKGNDSDYQEELEEVQAVVSGLQIPTGENYAVFGQEDPPAAAVPAAPATAPVWEFLGPLAAGPFIAQVKNNGKLAAGPTGFRLRNDSDVVKGWDSTGSEPWTSVNVGQQNNLVKAVFPVPVKYTEYELVVEPGKESIISLQNNAITGKVTNFTIVGGTENPKADILLRKKGTTPTVIATLHVHCFTPRVAKIGIYRVFDSANVNTQAPDQGIMADNATIIADLNQTFGLQAGVTFAVDASSRRVDMTDTNVFNADGSIDVSFNNGAQLNTIAGVTAILVSQDNKPLPKLRLYLVQSLNGTKEAYGGLTGTNTDVNVNPGAAFANCFVNRSQPSDTVRHEVGHGLGLSQQKQGQANSHDNGKWPVELHPSTGDPKPSGLMNDSANGRAWLRNNDWDWANKTGHYYE